MKKFKLFTSKSYNKLEDKRRTPKSFIIKAYKKLEEIGSSAAWALRN